MTQTVAFAVAALSSRSQCRGKIASGFDEFRIQIHGLFELLDRLSHLPDICECDPEAIVPGREVGECAYCRPEAVHCLRELATCEQQRTELVLCATVVRRDLNGAAEVFDRL